MTMYEPIGFISTSISILLSTFILLKIVKWNKQSFQHDFHYRIRFILAVLLLLNRCCQLVHLSLLLVKNSDTTKGYLNRYQTLFYALFFISLYCVLVLLLFSSMDRHARITLVCRGTLAYFIYWLIYLVYVIMVICIAFGYSGYYIVFDGIVAEIHWAQVLQFYRGYIEVACILSGMLIYYFFNVRLLFLSMNSIFADTQSGPARLIFILLGIFGIPYYSTSSNTYSPIQIKKLAVISRMLRYFLVLFTVDTLILFLGYLFAQDRGDYDYFIAFPYSWLPIHIFCLFKLLDLFLMQWKEAGKRSNRVPLQALTHAKLESKQDTEQSADTSFSRGMTSNKNTQSELYTEKMPSKTFEATIDSVN